MPLFYQMTFSEYPPISKYVRLCNQLFTVRHVSSFSNILLPTVQGWFGGK